MTPAQLSILLAPPAAEPNGNDVARELREMGLLLGLSGLPGQRALGDKLRVLADSVVELDEAVEERIEEAKKDAAEEALDFDKLDEGQRAEMFANLLGEVVAGRLELDFEEPNPGDPLAQKRIARRVRWLRELHERLTGDEVVPHVCAAGGAEVSRKLLELHEARIAPVLRAGGTLPDGMRWNKAIALRWFEAISEKLGEAEKLAKGTP